MTTTTIAEYTVPGQCTVTWVIDRRGMHRVTYGKQITRFNKSLDLKAAEEFGYCVRHAAECAGMFD